jgi:hypothetical protein
MTSQCPRCLSSFFPRLGDKCTFCIGHFDYSQPVRAKNYLPVLEPLQRVKLRFDGEPPTVLNGLDRTTSGAIGQP